MSNITKDAQGVYRWVYEFNLWTNPTILITVLKVMLLVVAILTVFMFALLVPDLISGELYAWQVEGTLQMGAIMLGVMVGLTLIGYVVYALMTGGKYCVVFTMDQNGVEHKQLPKQFKKAQVVGAINVLAGLATGSPGQVGLGILTSSRNSSYSSFGSVRSIKGSRALKVIKVNQPMVKNQVYVDRDDYDFVFNYIVSHCVNATKVRG